MALSLATTIEYDSASDDDSEENSEGGEAGGDASTKTTKQRATDGDHGKRTKQSHKTKSQHKNSTHDKKKHTNKESKTGGGGGGGGKGGGGGGKAKKKAVKKSRDVNHEDAEREHQVGREPATSPSEDRHDAEWLVTEDDNDRRQTTSPNEDRHDAEWLVTQDDNDQRQTTSPSEDRHDVEWLVTEDDNDRRQTTSPSEDRHDVEWLVTEDDNDRRQTTLDDTDASCEYQQTTSDDEEQNSDVKDSRDLYDSEINPTVNGMRTFGVKKGVITRAVVRFPVAPEPRPLTLCFQFPGTFLTHRYVLEMLRAKLPAGSDARVSAIQFEDRNTIHGTQGLDNRWLVTLNHKKAVDGLLDSGLNLFNRKIKLRRYDDVLNDEYSEYKQYVDMQMKLFARKQHQQHLAAGTGSGPGEVCSRAGPVQATLPPGPRVTPVARGRSPWTRAEECWPSSISSSRKRPTRPPTILQNHHPSTVRDNVLNSTNQDVAI